MAKWWKEELDTSKHRDHIRAIWRGGYIPEPPKDNLIEKWVYFVEVCSFTFQFMSLAQIREALEYFTQRGHPISSTKKRGPGWSGEHWWQAWYQRLPARLFKKSKREKIIKAFKKAIEHFENEE